ncbi:MAG: DUF6141 family protein [Bryobacteraceae bacterium]
MSRAPDLIFEEEQPFRQPRLMITLAIPPLIMALLAIWQVGFGRAWGKQTMSNAGVIGWTVFLWLVYWRLVTVKLITRVGGGEVSVRMRGLWRTRRIPLERIASCEVAAFDPMRDFGGRGIRATHTGKAYVAQGNRGVRLQLKTGGTVLIGSAKADDLKSTIDSVIAAAGKRPAN